MNTESKNKFAIRLFAILFIYAGVHTVFEMLYSLLDSRFRADLGFLGIFIGRGLLAGKDVWRKWALLVAWMGIVFTPITFGLFLHFGANQPAIFYGVQTNFVPPSYLLILIAAAIVTFCLWQRRILASPTVIATFTPAGGATDPWWRPLALASVLICAMEFTAQFLVTKTLRDLDGSRKDLIGNLQHHTIKYYAVDAETGASLSPGYSSFSYGMLPKISLESWAEHNGTNMVELSWISSGPTSTNIQLTLPGYEDEDLTLDPVLDGKTIRIELKKGRSSSPSP